MSCFHPMRAFDVGDRTAKGKVKYQIEGETTTWVRRKDTGMPTHKYVEIPCGKCIGCRLEYSRQWAVRCLLESEYHNENYFITLTYDEEHLPRTLGNTCDGVLNEIVPTLKPKDLTDFIKRLRMYYKRHYDIDNIRYFACGEYGETYGRPHYHVIIFGLPIPDIEYFYTSIKTGEIVYKSDLLNSIWQNGFVGVGKVSFESCAYVARYVVKKRKGPDAKEYYQSLGIVPEFVRMSRRPGIAAAYFEDHKNEIYNVDEIIISRKNGPQKVKPCRYYDQKFDLEEPDLLAKIKENRQNGAKEALLQKLKRTSLTEEQYRELLEKNKMQSASKLLRKLEKM